MKTLPYLQLLLMVNTAIVEVQSSNTLVDSLQKEPAMADFYKQDIDHNLELAKTDLSNSLFELQMLVDAIEICFNIHHLDAKRNAKELKRMNNFITRANDVLMSGSGYMSWLLNFTAVQPEDVDAYFVAFKG